MANTDKLIISVAGIIAEVAFKDIKNLHISVTPPLGKVKVSAPFSMTEDSIRRALIQRLAWIKRHKVRYAKTDRQGAREMYSGETHYVFGKRYLLDSSTSSKSYSLQFSGDTLLLRSPERSSQENKLAFLESWYRDALKAQATPFLEKWKKELNLQINQLNVRKMKTKWGTCNVQKGSICLNLELAKKNPRLLEYVIVHELLHFIEPHHGEGFVQLMARHIPDWRLRRDTLNAGPLGYANWSDLDLQL